MSSHSNIQQHDFWPNSRRCRFQAVLQKQEQLNGANTIRDCFEDADASLAYIVLRIRELSGQLRQEIPTRHHHQIEMSAVLSPTDLR